MPISDLYNNPEVLDAFTRAWNRAVEAREARVRDSVYTYDITIDEWTSYTLEDTIWLSEEELNNV